MDASTLPGSVGEPMNPMLSILGILIGAVLGGALLDLAREDTKAVVPRIGVWLAKRAESWLRPGDRAFFGWHAEALAMWDEALNGRRTRIGVLLFGLEKVLWSGQRLRPRVNSAPSGAFSYTQAFGLGLLLAIFLNWEIHWILKALIALLALVRFGLEVAMRRVAGILTERRAGRAAHGG